MRRDDISIDDLKLFKTISNKIIYVAVIIIIIFCFISYGVIKNIEKSEDKKHYIKILNEHMDFYHNIGKSYHINGEFDKAILNYKKALHQGETKHDVQYIFDDEIVYDMILALYHQSYYQVRSREIEINHSKFENIDFKVMEMPDDCNCFLNHYLSPNKNMVDEFSILIGVNNYTDIEELYDSFEIQIRSEDMFKYRMWYEHFTHIEDLNISVEGYDLFYCILENVDYERGKQNNTNMDLYIYQKYDSCINLAIIGDLDKPDYDEDGDVDGHYVFHDRYDDTWWNHTYFDSDSIYEVL